MPPIGFLTAPRVHAHRYACHRSNGGIVPAYCSSFLSWLPPPNTLKSRASTIRMVMRLDELSGSGREVEPRRPTTFQCYDHFLRHSDCGPPLRIFFFALLRMSTIETTPVCVPNEIPSPLSAFPSTLSDYTKLRRRRPSITLLPQLPIRLPLNDLADDT